MLHDAVVPPAKWLYVLLEMVLYEKQTLNFATRIFEHVVLAPGFTVVTGRSGDTFTYDNLVMAVEVQSLSFRDMPKLRAEAEAWSPRLRNLYLDSRDQDQASSKWFFDFHNELMTAAIWLELGVCYDLDCPSSMAVTGDRVRFDDVIFREPFEVGQFHNRRIAFATFF